MKIKVLMIPADRKAYVTNIENTLYNMQKTVGGYIESITLSKASVPGILPCSMGGEQ